MSENTGVDRLRSWLCIFIFLVLATTAYAHFGSCEDHSHQCPKWRSWGYCQSNLRFMALNCPVTCNVCLDPGCFDRNRDCSTYARRGFCQQYPQQLQSICPHSCNFCRVPEVFNQPLNARSITEPDFECGKPVGGRTKRQIIFPDELEHRTRDKLMRQSAPIMALGTGFPEAPVERVSVEDAFCGATLIHERFVVTAAHCVLDPNNPVRTVRLGELDFSTENEENSKPVDYKVKLITVHQDFKPSTLERYNDIAVIETEQNVQLNDIVYPFCLSRTRPSSDSLVTGSGFGFVNSTHRSQNLQDVELKVVDSAECIGRYEREGLRESIQTRYPQLLQEQDIFCAAFPGRDACEGDSGGPLYQDVSEKRFLVGVVGLGISCRGNGISDLPGFYVSIADHIDFINSVIYGL